MQPLALLIEYRRHVLRALLILLTAVTSILPASSVAQTSCAKLYSSTVSASAGLTSDVSSRTVKSISAQQVAEGFPEFVGEDIYYGLSTARRISLQIRRTDSWSAPDEFAGKGIEISIPVKDRAQGNAVLKYLLNPLQIDSSPLATHPERHEADLPYGIFAKFEVSKESTGSIVPSMRLVLTNKESHSLAAGELLMRALINKGLYKKRDDEIIFDRPTNTDRHEWAVHTFKGNRNLSNQEHRALFDIGTGDFRTIHNSLRQADWAPDRRVPFIDSAIAKGRTDREVTVYRSVYREDLKKLWEELIEGNRINSEITPDPAYLFASLDPAVARWWQRSWNERSDGVILEIELPAGTNAAYLDSAVHERRGYLEIILPRNAKLTALNAIKDGSYKIIRVRLHQ